MRAYSDKINHAFAYAAVHSPEFRKGTLVPYITHPGNVALILARYDQDDETVCAALLHDVVEDCKRHTRAEHAAAIEAKFGAEVIEAVLDVTKPEIKDSRKSKDLYLEHLAHACDRARWVSAADKLHNARCILSDLDRAADASTVWGRFNVSAPETVQWYRRVYDRLVKLGWGAPILPELLEAVEALERLPIPEV